MIDNSYALKEENIEKEHFHYLDIFLTKQMCNLILVLGYRILSNKEIAEKMGIKSSALSNILQRMKRSVLPLLCIQKQEKYMMYSLTPIALEYMEQRLVVEEKNSSKVINLRSESELNLESCLSALNGIRELFREDFEIEFVKLLIAHYSQNVQVENNDFQKFVSYFEKMIIWEQKKEFEIVLEAIGSVSLKNEVLKYVNKYIYIRSLCRICAKNWRLAYIFVDSFFDSKCKSISLDFLKVYPDILGSDVIGITESLMEMVNNTKGKSVSKEGIFEYWSDYFLSQEQLLYYIAEKIVWLNLR